MTERLVTVPYDCDDIALVRALVADDRRAPEVLWRRYKSTVFGTLRRVLGPDPETEDLAHDVFLTVYRRAPTTRYASEVCVRAGYDARSQSRRVPSTWRRHPMLIRGKRFPVCARSWTA